MWSLYNQKGDLLEPLKFSNNKTQEDIVTQVLEAVKKGYKVIFIKGNPGTGKSAIALNIAKEFERASIVVPVKYLQRQYEEDYMKRLYLLKDGRRLRISSITGRNNHKCLYQEGKADNIFLPCCIPIKKENFEIIKQYIENNKLVDSNDFESIDDVSRIAVGSACPYWSPIISKEFYSKKIADAEPIEYEGVSGIINVYHRRKPGCGYYEQFLGYIYSDVIIFNSRMYLIENLINRKPSTSIEVIDECDEFLDNLGNERNVNLDYFMSRIDNFLKSCKNEKIREILDVIYELIQDTKQEYTENILKLKESKVNELFTFLRESTEIMEYEDFEDYYLIAEEFKHHKDDTYLSYSRNKKGSVIVTLVNVDLAKRFNNLLDKNKVFVMMSGTLHSDQVLRDVFGIKDYVIIDAETKEHGTVNRLFTRLEKNFRYKEFREGNVSREEYLKALEKCIEQGKRPILVHVNAVSDLPVEEEKERYGLMLLKTQEDLLREQEMYRLGEVLQRFKEGKIDILYSTKCGRGVDLPGEMCNSIVFTKYPYPSMDSLFWKVLKKSNSDNFMKFYFDKARREYVQRIYRGLRSKEDTVFLLSPDIQVLRR